jgi:hypothetical protein
VYWFNLFYYESPAVFIDYVYYWGGLLAWGLRMMAWMKKQRKQSAAQTKTAGTSNLLLYVSGIVMVAIGLTGSSLGSVWSPQVYEFLFSFGVVESIDAFMPYFPLVPFYPIFVIMSGAFLIVRSRG